MSFTPRDDYRRQEHGENVGQFENEARTWAIAPFAIVDVRELGETPALTTAHAVVEVTKPDPRLTVELFIGYVPRDEDINLGLDVGTANGRTVAQNLADSRAWVSLCEDFGGGLVEAEDEIGTRAAPVSFVAPGLWGVTYEVDVDCVAVHVALDLVSAGVLGRWMVGARWTAAEDMSERDWTHARTNMNLVARPRALQAIQVFRSVGGPT
jgi:hypothetical protein